jgi:hypothetical protein
MVLKKSSITKLVFSTARLVLVSSAKPESIPLNSSTSTGVNIMSFRSLFSMLTVLIISVALIFGLSVNPSMAGSSSVTKGTEQLPKIDAAAEKVAEKSGPMGLAEVEARSKGGLNEIQGSADANKMHKADTSKPGPAMAKKIDKALDKVIK